MKKISTSLYNNILRLTDLDFSSTSSVNPLNYLFSSSSSHYVYCIAIIKSFQTQKNNIFTSPSMIGG